MAAPRAFEGSGDRRVYFPDLSPYSYGKGIVEVGVYNVGWLSSARDYPQGPCPEGFLARIDQRAQSPVNLFRGSHLCEFCPPPETEIRNGMEIIKPLTERMGDGEIRVVGRDGAVYAAPVMIAHYIREHGYLPPRQFIDAVLEDHPSSDKPRLTIGVIGDDDKTRLLATLSEIANQPK